MPDLSVPVPVMPIDWDTLPRALRDKFRGHVVAVCRSLEECQDLGARFYGDLAFMPYQPILLYYENVPAMVTPSIVIGDGVTTVAELRDLCVDTWGKRLEAIAHNGGRMFDFEALRERAGLPQREAADAAIRNEMQDRVKRHKANPITDPGRDPMRDSYPQQSFPVSNGRVDWPLGRPDEGNTA